VTSTPTRTVDAIELPAAGRWEIDPGHTEVAFVGRHFMLTKIRGRFTGVTGAVDVDENPAASTVSVTIDMSSVNSGDSTRDDHLRSNDLFDVENHPTATFRSTRIDWDGTNGRIHGELTIKGVTRPVILDTQYRGFARDPWGGERVVFTARTRVNREDWNVSWNMVLETGGLLVSKEIDIEVETELVRQ
jgi:polyisoprenoid-binding protein YceI